MYYPKEATVQFINRFIRKKIAKKEGGVIDVYKNYRGNAKALDFGCGIGRNTIMMRDFNIESYGIDISKNAIVEAKELAVDHNVDMDNFFMVYDGQNIPFKDNFFDFTISEGVLDSLPFELAKDLLKEIDRVTKKYFYLSLISSESGSLFTDLGDKYEGEIEVDEEHEKGTIQSFFNENKIKELIKNTKFKIKYLELIEHKDLLKNIKHGRYHVVLEK